MSFFLHLECSAGCGAPSRTATGRHHLCECGAPLFARYDLERARRWSRDRLNTRPPNMWRYRELMPIFDGEEPVTLGEGFTPLIHARALGAALGIDRLYIKDESLNPTQSFKARGQSAAITRARYLGAKTIALPTAGNAGNAAAAYSAAAGLACQVFMPNDAKQPFVDECRLYGATVTLVEGLITDAGALAAEKSAALGWYDVSTLKEPYRAEGKKTMAYEVAEQLDWTWPDWMVYPTGGGTGIVGMWKAIEELERIGWMTEQKRPRLVSVQARNCAPIVRAFQEGRQRARPWESASTIADGLRVPRAIGDFLILNALRESGGTAVAVTDEAMVRGMLILGAREGVSAAPEGGAALAGLEALVAGGTIKPHESVVLFNTGGALKYLDLLH